MPPPGADDRSAPPFMLNPHPMYSFLANNQQQQQQQQQQPPVMGQSASTSQATLRGNRWAGGSITETPPREGDHTGEVKELRAALAELQSDMARFRGSFQSLLAEVGQAMEGCVDRLKKFEERLANSEGNSSGGVPNPDADSSRT